MKTEQVYNQMQSHHDKSAERNNWKNSLLLFTTQV